MADGGGRAHGGRPSGGGRPRFGAAARDARNGRAGARPHLPGRRASGRSRRGGRGPAGLAAAVYGASEGLVTVLLDQSGLGGQAAKSARIENYLGFPQGVSGADLTRLAMVQALKFGVRIHSPCAVTGLDLSDDRRLAVLLEDGVRIQCRAVIAATGARYRRLDIPRWAAFEQGRLHPVRGDRTGRPRL
ncbi:NAD(P)/FAD-dependent oxidoreductase [Streptosporangium lutulentum]